MVRRARACVGQQYGTVYHVVASNAVQLFYLSLSKTTRIAMTTQEATPEATPPFTGEQLAWLQATFGTTGPPSTVAVDAGGDEDTPPATQHESGKRGRALVFTYLASGPLAPPERPRQAPIKVTAAPAMPDITRARMRERLFRARQCTSHCPPPPPRAGPPVS